MKNTKFVFIGGTLLLSAALIALLAVWFTADQPTINFDTTVGEEIDIGELVNANDAVTTDQPNPLEIANQFTMNPTAIITTNRGVIELELFVDQMPITTGNFIALAESGFYDDTKFHRVIPDFMIQGGDPNTKSDDASQYGFGGPGYTIEDEHVAGDNLTNVRGTIAMANSGPNSGGSQFFINLVDNTRLDWDKEPLMSQHPVFGVVTAGMDVVDAIGQTPTGPNDLPVEPVVVESVEIRGGEGG